MHQLWNSIISPLLTITRPKVIVEIGSDQGTNTENILELSREWDGIVQVVDPLPKYYVTEWEKRYGPRLQVHKELSLKVLPSLPLAQAYLIDGDHNWYTVINELRLIGGAASKKGSAFPLVLLHDTGWPYGRRDLYYNPQTIPDAFRKPFRQAGMSPGADELVGAGGLNAHLNNAMHANGRQNGVLTAVEDFVRETALDLVTFNAPAYHGLTVIASRSQLQKSLRVARFLKQFGFSSLAARLLGDLERSRVDAEIARQVEKRRRETELTALQGQLKRQAAQLEVANRDVEAAHKRTTAAEQLNTQLQESRERQEALIKLKDEGAARADERIRALSERLTGAETEATVSNALKIAFERQVQDLTEEHRQILEIQEAAARRAQELTREFEQRLKDAQSEAEIAQARAAALSQDLDRSRQRHADLVRANEGIEKRHDETIKLKDDVIAQAQQAIADHEQTVRELHERLKLAKLDLRLGVWEQIARGAKQQAEQLRAELRSKVTEAMDAHKRVNQLVRDIRWKEEEIRKAQDAARREKLELRVLIEFKECFDASIARQAASRVLGQWFPGQVAAKITRRLAQRVQQTSLFDESWYLKKYPDVARSGMDAALHFTRYGVFEGRDPNATFSTKYYLAENSDVVRAGINPLIHYAEHGAKEGRSRTRRIQERVAPESEAAIQQRARPRVEIVIPVFDALEEVGKCLLAVLRHSGRDFRIVIVNDGSAPETTHWLRWFAERYENLVVLLENEVNQGYTRSINRGIQETTGDYVVLLNSDTIVTPEWLDRLRQCAESSSRIGIVGPLSNAASWQNIPQLIGADGKFAVNVLPQGWTPEAMAELVAESAGRLYPRVPFLNGFCFAIKRKVIEAVGLFDDKNFPRGYGEENDYALRAVAAGYELAVADDCYVYHAKSKSFGHAQRLTLSQDGNEALKRKHGQNRIEALVKEIRNSEALAEIRARIARHPKLQVQSIVRTSFSPSMMLGQIAFLLPVSGVAGGIHSVMQEASAMRVLGIDAKVLIRAKDHSQYMSDYGRLPYIRELLLPFDSSEHLLTVTRGAAVVVATIFTSVSSLSKIREADPKMIAAYYVQDYEPLFFDTEQPRTHEAEASYTLIPGIACFAKTDWICEQVSARHGISVERVIASIDHGVYHPRGRSEANGRLGVAAMIRPHTPRRGAHRTLRTLRKIANQFGEEIRIEIFGCDEAALEKHGLQADFPCHNSGVLTQEQVADVLRRNDIFLDLSDYQAFGRTALEAMACGCVVFVTDRGGASEFCIEGENGFLVDVEDDSSVISRVASMIEDQELRNAIVQKALTTAARYSPRSAALSEAFVFLDCISGQTSQAQTQILPRVETSVAQIALKSGTTIQAG